MTFVVLLIVIFLSLCNIERVCCNRTNSIEKRIRDETNTFPTFLELRTIREDQVYSSGSTASDVRRARRLAEYYIQCNDNVLLSDCLDWACNEIDVQFLILSVAVDFSLGTIPTDIGTSCSGVLEEIGLRGHQIHGRIPSEMGDLNITTKIDLSENSLIGTIPVELGKMTQLRELELNRNMLSGGVRPRHTTGLSAAIAFLRCHIVCAYAYGSHRISYRFQQKDFRA